MPESILLRDFIKDVADEQGRLPLVHSTDLFRFQQIRLSGKLSTAECPVYQGEKLLYFFYGRPSYRPHLTEGPLDARSFAPVCMVFNHELANHAMRVMPFDSGAFHHQRTHPPIHEGMTREDFELTVNTNAPMKLITTFFGSERDYLDEKPAPVEGIDEWADFHVDAYYRLIRRGGNQGSDERISAIELQFDRAVPLARQLMAVILPAPYLDRPGIREQIEGWGAIGIPYQMGGTFRPIEIHGAIVDKLHDFLAQQGLP